MRTTSGRLLLPIFCALIVWLVSVPTAHAWGVPSPGGPPIPCGDSQVDRNHVQLGLGMGQFDTTIRFEGDRDVEVEMSSVSASGAWLINEQWSVRAAGGILTDGKLVGDHGLNHDVDSGGLVAVGGEYRALVGDRGVPFVDLSLTLGVSWAQTLTPGVSDKTNYSAFDMRLGGRAGWLIGGKLFPYAALRIFGGPVNWKLDGEDVTGSDIHHYQIALGASLQLGPVGIYAEWAGLGEMAFSAGLSTAW